MLKIKHENVFYRAVKLKVTYDEEHLSSNKIVATEMINGLNVKNHDFPYYCYTHSQC